MFYNLNKVVGCLVEGGDLEDAEDLVDDPLRDLVEGGEAYLIDEHVIHVLLLDFNGFSVYFWYCLVHIIGDKGLRKVVFSIGLGYGCWIYVLFGEEGFKYLLDEVVSHGLLAFVANNVECIIEDAGVDFEVGFRNGDVTYCLDL